MKNLDSSVGELVIGEEGRFVIKASSRFCMASAVVFTAEVKYVPQCSRITCA